jgi:hypothetical protein
MKNQDVSKLVVERYFSLEACINCRKKFFINLYIFLFFCRKVKCDGFVKIKLKIYKVIVNYLVVLA